jgi:DRTGG domain.
MKIKDILDAVDGETIYVSDPHVYEIDFQSAFGSDLMSDALCHLREADETELLITGLANMQIFHTANTLDLAAILIVRGKTIDEHLIQGAKMSEISVFKTDYTMYETCGRLYEKGLGK